LEEGCVRLGEQHMLVQQNPAASYLPSRFRIAARKVMARTDNVQLFIAQVFEEEVEIAIRLQIVACTASTRMLLIRR
jgi:hypothetical protein